MEARQGGGADRIAPCRAAHALRSCHLLPAPRGRIGGSRAIIHAIEESGDALTLEVFKSEYHKLLEAYFAENFVLDPELDLECLRIPHFYHAFYVYKYATGLSAAMMVFCV